jgi:hypothetical protein
LKIPKRQIVIKDQTTLYKYNPYESMIKSFT